MVITSSLPAANFPTAKTHKHSHAGKAQPEANANADSLSDSQAVSAENQVAATSINSPADAMKALAGIRQAMLQQPNQALQAQAHLAPETVLQLLQA